MEWTLSPPPITLANVPDQWATVLAWLLFLGGGGGSEVSRKDSRPAQHRSLCTPRTQNPREALGSLVASVRRAHTSRGLTKRVLDHFVIFTDIQLELGDLIKDVKLNVVGYLCGSRPEMHVLQEARGIQWFGCIVKKRQLSSKEMARELSIFTFPSFFLLLPKNFFARGIHCICTLRSPPLLRRRKSSLLPHQLRPRSIRDH